MYSMGDYYDAEGDDLPPRAHPYGWVPVDKRELRTTVRPTTGHVQTKTSTVLPLEFYDSPEMELVPPERKLAQVCDNVLQQLQWYRDEELLV
jgi:hypothetical protein